jgi:Tfp pilus assembly protein PilN
MRPVNLLPAKDRPRTGTGDSSGSSYVALGVLGVLLLAVLAYVLTSNSISSKKDEITRAENETRQAQARAAALGSYESFAQIKETRVQAVKLLAEQRFDWERLSRELAHVLPAGVSLTGMEASLAGDDAASGSSTPSSASSSAGAQTASAERAAKLSGCARDPDDVAVLLVRLQRLHRADEVELNESVSTKKENSAGPSSGSGSGSQTCGSKQHYTYTATVTFSPAPPAGDPDGGKVPARLGGGS